MWVLYALYYIVIMVSVILSYLGNVPLEWNILYVFLVIIINLLVLKK
jgi:hypothetical protein